MKIWNGLMLHNDLRLLGWMNLTSFWNFWIFISNCCSDYEYTCSCVAFVHVFLWSRDNHATETEQCRVSAGWNPESVPEAQASTDSKVSQVQGEIQPFSTEHSLEFKSTSIDFQWLIMTHDSWLVGNFKSVELVFFLMPGPKRHLVSIYLFF